MAAEYKHKRYFRIRLADSSLYTFISTSDAYTKIDFKSAWTTSSPTKSETLADSNQTFVVTYEFNSEAEQTAFKTAIDGEWADGLQPWNGNDSNQTIEHFKTEWLTPDGSVSCTVNF